MPDSLCERKSLKEYQTILFNNKLNNNEYRKIRNEIKNELDNNKNLILSDYFQYFDENNVKIKNMKQNYYLNIASEIALKSNMSQKHGAIIVYKKEIIAIGYNYYYNSYSIHAEVSAISKLKGIEKNKLINCELYVVRIGSKSLNNILKYSKPCSNCQKYILKNMIKKTYYSTNYEYDNAVSICCI